MWPQRLGIHLRNMKRGDFCFRSFIFSFLNHRKHRTVKGVEVKLRKSIQVMLISKSYNYPILLSEAIGNLISVQSISSVTEMKIFWSLRNLFWLRIYEFASADCLHSEEHDSPEEFEPQISDHCCALCQLSQNIYPPTGHIIEEHLCLIMSGCSLDYK